MALAGRNSGVRCSELLSIASETAALDLDLACTLRLLEFDNKREYERLQGFKNAVKEAVAELFGGKSNDPENDDDLELSEDDIL